MINKHIAIEKLQIATSNETNPDIAKGLLLAQKIIINMPDEERPQGDLISREALKDKAETVTLWNGEVRRFVSYETIDNAPTVCGNNPKWCESCISKGKCASTRPQGEWIGDTDYESYQGCYEAYKCNKCGYGLHWRDYCNSDVSKNFCPNCGADMRKGEVKNE